MRPVHRSIGSAAIIAIAAVFFQGCGNSAPGGDEIAARVGNVTISDLDVGYRMAIDAAYGGDTLPYHTALVALINDGLERETARSLGLLPSREEIGEFSRHVETTTQAPEILSGVKRVFGSDTAAYVRLYLESKVIGEKLHLHQYYDTTVQRGPRARVVKAFGMIAGGASFGEAASSVDGVAFVGRVPGDAADSVGGNGRRADSTIIDDPAIRSVLPGLKPGLLFEQVLEDEHFYRLIRLLGSNAKGDTVEVLAVQKAPYEEWFRGLAANIPIDISEPEMRAEVKRSHPNVWWIERGVLR